MKILTAAAVKIFFLTAAAFVSIMANVMDDRIYQGYLYDFYGELLNEHRREVYEEYVNEDLSLNEIAEERGVSRQSVFDLIKRCNEALYSYEDKLHLVGRFLEVQEQAKEIEKLSAGTENAEMRRIHSLSKEILKEL